jgi:hypothetical protein
MSYQSRIRDIQSAFVMGYHDRETCIEMFEALLKEFGFLPPTESLDRAITNENFLALLKAAKDGNKTKMQQLEAQALAQQQQLAERALNHGMEQANYRIADSVKQRCPVCQKPINALFNRVQSIDMQVLPVDPPRCQECMMAWVRERFDMAHAVRTNSSLDGTPVSPMSPSELDFFAVYEKQMTTKETDDGA